MFELLTVFDEQGNEIGVEEREVIHTKGLWHHTFHCWFVERNDEEAYLYFQLRSVSKQDFPSTLDITAAGHIESHEEIGTAGIREIKEELGIALEEKDLSYQGCYQEEIHTKDMVDREFCHIYFYPVTETPDFTATEEVDDIVRLSSRVFEEVLQGKQVDGHYMLRDQIKKLALDDFCPHSVGYFSFLLHALNSYYSL